MCVCVHCSATALKGEVNNIDYLVTMAPVTAVGRLRQQVNSRFFSVWVVYTLQTCSVNRSGGSGRYRMWSLNWLLSWRQKLHVSVVGEWFFKLYLGTAENKFSKSKPRKTTVEVGWTSFPKWKMITCKWQSHCSSCFLPTVNVCFFNHHLKHKPWSFPEL